MLFGESKEKKAERIRAEYKQKQEEISATLKYDMANGELDCMKGELGSMRNEMASLANAEVMYQNAYATKVKFIEENNLPAAGQIVELETKMIHLSSEQNVLRDAIDAGERIVHNASFLGEKLDDDMYWRVLEVFKENRVPWVIRRPRIEEVEDVVVGLHKSLSEMRTILSDACVSEDVKVVSKEFLEYSYIIYDLFSIDIMTNRKLDKTRKGLVIIVKQIAGIVENLKQLHDDIAEQNAQLRKDYEALIYSL